MIKSWTEEAWNDYLDWQKEDRKILRRINLLLEDILKVYRDMKNSINTAERELLMNIMQNTLTKTPLRPIAI